MEHVISMDNHFKRAGNYNRRLANWKHHDQGCSMTCSKPSGGGVFLPFPGERLLDGAALRPRLQGSFIHASRLRCRRSPSC